MDVVEQLLDAASGPSASMTSHNERAAVQHALAICACVTVDEAPRWLIYDTVDGGLRWRRVPGRSDALNLVDARFAASGHADPAEVLRWLRRDASDPWGSGGDGDGDRDVFEALRERIKPK